MKGFLDRSTRSGQPKWAQAPVDVASDRTYTLGINPGLLGTAMSKGIGESPRATNRNMGHAVERGSTPDEYEAFRKHVRRALGVMQTLPVYAPALEAFFTTYEYRRQFPWLGESGSTTAEFGGNGLAYAISYALETYVPPLDGIPRATTQPGDSCISAPISRLAEQRLAMDQALALFIQEQIGVDEFAYSLECAGVDISGLDDHHLFQHLTLAFEQYADQRMVGLDLHAF